MVLEYLRVLPSCCGYLGVSLAAAAVALAVFAASFGPLGPYDDNAYISAAAMRALETAHEPPRTRLFNDTLALELLPASWARPGVLLLVAALRGLASRFERALHRPPNRGRLSQFLWLGPCRTRMVDNAIVDAVRHSGARQVVIVGAGYDGRRR